MDFDQRTQSERGTAENGRKVKKERKKRLKKNLNKKKKEKTPEPYMPGRLVSVCMRREPRCPNQAMNENENENKNMGNNKQLKEIFDLPNVFCLMRQLGSLCWRHPVLNSLRVPRLRTHE